MPHTGLDFEGFRAYAAKVKRIPALDRAAELDLARRYAAGENDAGDQLVESQLRTVVHLAHKYRGYGIPASDLVGEGNIGLLDHV